MAPAKQRFNVVSFLSSSPLFFTPTRWAQRSRRPPSSTLNSHWAARPAMLGRSAATPGRSPRAPVKLKPAKRRTEPEPAEESADHGDKTAVPPPTVPEKRTASQRDADSESEDEIAQYDSSESKKATPEKIKINWRVKLQPASRSKSGAKPPLPPAGTPKKDTTATPRKEPVSARKPSAAVEDKEAGGRTVTPRKGGLASGATSAAGTPSRNVRFTADTKPPASKPSKDTKDPVSSSPDEKSARVTRSQTTITPTKPSQSASKPGQTLITPTKSPSIPSMRTPRTPRITGRPTRDLLSNLNLTDAFSARVQEKAMSLYERYISRRNQGRSHGFPSAGFVEVACIDLACDFCGEKNEQFALLIGHAQLGKEELARQLYPGYKKELERYLDVPPSARKTRQAVRDEDEDEEQTERLRPSDLSALINRLGIPEVKEDVVELLSIYAKGLKGVAAGDRDKWVWGPAVVGGAVKSVGEAWGVSA